tara:strand:- start:1688 stop:2251 length:564 start_codon:yes stop_codon:yes gene_type:complete
MNDTFNKRLDLILLINEEMGLLPNQDDDQTKIGGPKPSPGSSSKPPPESGGNYGDEFYPDPGETEEDFPESDKAPVSSQIVKMVRFLAKALLTTTYGPIGWIIDNFVPAAIITELIRSIRMYGDTLIGDMRASRELTKKLRQSVINRKRIKNQEMQDAILNGEYDDRLDELLYSGETPAAVKIWKNQ